MVFIYVTEGCRLQRCTFDAETPGGSALAPWGSMLLDQVTDTEMRAAQIIGAFTMVGFLAAPMFRRRAQTVRLVLAGAYVACLLGFLLYVLL